jgi:serine protease Do
MSIRVFPPHYFRGWSPAWRRAGKLDDNVAIRLKTRVNLGVGVAAALLALALVVGSLLGWLVTAESQWSPSGPGHVAPMYIAKDDGRAGDQVSFPAGFTPILKNVTPAVVNISSSKIVRNPQQNLAPFLNDPFFRQFFGDQPGKRFNIPREQLERSLGSGVIVSPDGYILTNNHVVDGSKEIRVALADKREFTARVVGTDPQTDVAVLKVDTTNLPAITLGDSARVQVGNFSLAIGDPFGVGQTVTMGIISAIGRGNLGIEEYEDFIQTDAAINPGNSGGALINERGELIGINTAIVSNGAQGNQGVGFAIPINMARQVMDQILKHGKVTRGYLGVQIQEVTPAIAKAFGLSSARGALVGDVTADGPAAKAGLLKGDIIVELNGEPITDSRTLRLRISQTAPGTSVRLKVFHNGSERGFSVTLGELPAKPEAADAGNEPGGALEGVMIDELTPRILNQLGLPARTKGVVVTDVKPASLAADAGLQRGDVIQEVNRQAVASVAEFERAIGQTGKGPILLLVNRAGTTLYLAIESR